MKDELYAQRSSMLKNDRSCLTKRVFFSRQEASQASEAHRRPGEAKGRVYKCDNCKQFHIAVGKKNKVKKSKQELRKPFCKESKSVGQMAGLLDRTFYRRTTSFKEPFKNQRRAIRLMLYWWVGKKLT